MNFKKILFVFSLSAFSFAAKSQCSVTIIPDGTDTMCLGSYILLHTTTSFTNSSSVIDQEQTNYNGGMSALTGPDRSEFQTFVAGITGTLSQIDMGFFNFISGVGVVNLYDGNGILGTLLSTQNVNVNCPSGNCMIIFPQNNFITAGNTYTFQFIPGAGIPYPYGVQVQNPGSYSNGELFITDPSGTYPTGMDMVFATHVGELDSLSYLWSTGSTDSTILANGEEMYSITVTGSSCTAVDSVNITVINPDTTVIITGNTITAIQTNATYQWVDCENDFSVISGATNQSFSATNNGSYAVEISEHGCVVTTSCFEIEGLGDNEINSTESFIVYPNPSDGKFNIDLSDTRSINSSLKIEDVFGRIVFEKILTLKNETIDIRSFSYGTYFVFIDDRFKNIKPIKIIVN